MECNNRDITQSLLKRYKQNRKFAISQNLFVFNTRPMLLDRFQKYVMYGLLAEAMH